MVKKVLKLVQKLPKLVQKLLKMVQELPKLVHNLLKMVQEFILFSFKPLNFTKFKFMG